MKIANCKSLNSLIATAILLNTSTTLAQTYQPSNRQPTADNTSIGTKVSPTGNNNFDITGGLSRGQTLFHSFSDFSIPTAGSTNFINPTGTRDIITRVTGNNYSDLNGRLNSNGANFFLINPNGVVFGANVKLNVGKVFVASTANSIDLVDGSGRAITFGTNSSGDAPLLSIAPDVAFNVSRFNFSGGTGEIRNFGSLDNYNQNPYVALIGGNITFDGRDGTGRIVAPTGRVDLGGLNGAGTVTIDDRGLVSSGNITWSDVSLLNGGHVYVLANQTVGTVDTFINNTTSPGSAINISANNVRLINDKSTPNTVKSYLGAGLTKYAGVNTATTGDININATGKVSLDNAEISNRIESGATGNIGNINIVSNRQVELDRKSSIFNSNFGLGESGNISISSDLVYLKDSSINAISENSSGGNIYLNNRNLLILRNNSNIVAESNSLDRNSNGGNIDIDSELIVAVPKENSDIIASAFNGRGGNVLIDSRHIFGLQFSLYPTDNSDIIASSSFGFVEPISIDNPARSVQLPSVPTDASNRISQACSSSTRENKLTVAGRGGLPVTADEPLTTDVVWQDPRSTSSQQLGSKITTSPLKLAPPTIGWVFDGNGKVRLIAAGNESSPKAKIICPKSN